MTTFADLYHPALGNVHIAVPNDPTALALYESHGWVLSTGGGPDPTPTDLTIGLGDLRYAKLGDITTAGTATGDALRTAFAARNFAQVDLCSAPYNLRPGDDATSALQTVLDAIGVTPQSTDIYFSRPGTYTLNGALQTGTALGYTWNGQVLIPAVGGINTTVAIRIRGAAPISPGGSARPASGTKLLTNATSGFIFDCKPSFTAFGATYPWTNVWLTFEDIIIEAPANPQCGGVKALICSYFGTRNVAVQTSDRTVARTGSGEAIVFPQNLNEYGGVIERTVIAGWPKAMRITEHATLLHLLITYCGTAFVGTYGSHVNRFDHVDVEQTATVFKLDDASGQGSPIVVHGDLSYESPGFTPGLFVDQPQPGCITGSLVVDFINPLGAPRISQPLGFTNGFLDLTNLRLQGARATSALHPSDNFQRIVTGVPGIGLSWPTLHAWFTNDGSFQVNGTPGSPGALVSTNGGGESMGLIPVKDAETGGHSRVISATFTLGASAPHVKVLGNYVFGGPNNTNVVFIDATTSHFYLSTFIGGVVSNLADGGALLTAGQTYTVSLEIVLNAMGLPVTVASYLNGTLVSTASLPGATTAALAPGIYYPPLNDGVAFYEASSQLTKFAVRDCTADELRGAFVSVQPGLTHWQRAKARVRTNAADAKILCVGDSTTAGIGVVDGTTQGVASSYPGQLAGLLNNAGLPASRGLGIPAPAALSDARWTLGTGWTAQTTLAWAGTADYGFTGSTFGSLVYADPNTQADRFDVYYLTGPGLGSFTATATGGSGVVQNTNASSGLGKVTVSAASLATTNAVTITPSGPVHIFAVEPWASGIKRVRVGNAGVGSSTATAWASDGGGAVWNSQACIKAYAPDLTIISLGLNDAGNGDPASTFLTHLAPLITAAQVSGDVMILPPIPPASSIGGSYLSLIADYTNGLRGLGLPLEDLPGRWTSGDAATALGYLWDARHPNAVGYADLAQLISRDLLIA